MKTIQATINLSEELYLSLSCFGLTKEKIVSESRKLLAAQYFQNKMLSLGKAAELSALSKLDFIEYLSTNHIPIIDYDQDEMDREFGMVENIVKELKR